jgi:hypothetical protein
VAEAKSRLIAIAAVRDTAVTFSTPELYERTGNVYEKKGLVKKSRDSRLKQLSSRKPEIGRKPLRESGTWLLTLDSQLLDFPTQKTHERTANVYEKKGSMRKRRGLSGNVYENKGSYPLKAGI